MTRLRMSLGAVTVLVRLKRTAERSRGGAVGLLIAVFPCLPKVT
ncbi:hypothetical protein GCM10010295_04390 [Streptomyces intermedius]